MNGERFFDDLARTLAEPMPRRRAVRVIGASLAALAVPGVSPRIAQAAARGSSLVCGPDQNLCSFNDPVTRQPLPQYCCPAPWWQFSCNADTRNGCVNHCPPKSASGKNQVPCASAAKVNGRTKTFQCCPVPEFKCDPNDIDLCVPNCKHTFGPRATQCGKNCCLPGQACRSGKCVSCPYGEEACATEDGGPSKCCCSGGRARCGSKCCPRGSRCADPARGRCEECPRRTEECGSTCCKRGTYCCNARKGVCCSDRNGSCCGDSPICCENKDCCQVALSRFPICCPQGETCGSAGNSAGLVAGRRTSICCTADRVVRLSGATICCPYGYVSLGGRLVANSGLCCERSRVCGTGTSITCCGPNTTCRNGRCVF